MRAEFIPQSAYMRIQSAAITSPATQTTYVVGDDFNPNGLEIDISDNEKTWNVDFQSPNYQDDGDTLKSNDTYEEIQVYQTHSRGAVKQPITVS